MFYPGGDLLKLTIAFIPLGGGGGCNVKYSDFSNTPPGEKSRFRKLPRVIEKYVVLEAFEVEDEADILPELHVAEESDDQELFI